MLSQAVTVGARARTHPRHAGSSRPPGDLLRARPYRRPLPGDGRGHPRARPRGRHHGYLHLQSERLDEAGSGPNWSRAWPRWQARRAPPATAPGLELTPETLALLAGLGFSYDSSLMADDRPYWISSGQQRLLELPGHWSLCDWPYFGYTSLHGGLLADPAAVERVWLEEFESARQERRLVTYTCTRRPSAGVTACGCCSAL